MMIRLTRNTVVDGNVREEGWEGDAVGKTARYLIAIGKAVLVDSLPHLEQEEAAPEEDIIETTLPVKPEKMVPGGRKKRGDR